MNNWYLGIAAVLFWILAALLYLRHPILNAIAQWRERRIMQAKIRADQASRRTAPKA